MRSLGREACAIAARGGVEARWRARGGKKFSIGAEVCTFELSDAKGSFPRTEGVRMLRELCKLMLDDMMGGTNGCFFFFVFAKEYVFQFSLYVSIAHCVMCKKKIEFILEEFQKL